MTTPNDLPSVGTEDALLEANQWEMMFGEPDAADMLRALVSERDELASRVRELEAEVLDQCRLNGMGAERESALMGRVRELESAAAPTEAKPAQDVVDAQPRLTVRLTSYPESNGKRNWTAMLVRVAPWDGLIGNCGGITIDRGELWNRVAYEAECARFLLGERDTQPHILDYGDDIETPDKWAGETRGGWLSDKSKPVRAAISAKKGQP